MTLSADVRVAGSYDPRPLPALLPSRRSTAIPSLSKARPMPARHRSSRSRSVLTESRSRTCSPTLPRTGIWSRCVPPTSHISMCIRTVIPVTVSRRLDRQSPSTPTCRALRTTVVPGLQTWRSGTYGGIHADGRQCDHAWGRTLEPRAPRALKPNAFRSNGKTGMGNRHASICSCRSEMRGDVRSDCSARQRKSKSLRTSPR